MKLIKYIGLLCLIVFSFYYTDKISTLIIYQSSLMQEIQKKKTDFELAAINAQKDGNYIIPGINGLKVNDIESYYQMKKAGSFLSSKIVFEEISPIISIENNKELIINKGNSARQAVSLLVHQNREIIEYSIKNDINITRLITSKEFDHNSKLEQINIDDNLKKTDKLLDNYRLNTYICILDHSDQNTCALNQKYLVLVTYHLSNVYNLKNTIFSGDIIYIDNEMSLEDFKYLIKFLQFRDLKVLKLSELISESNMLKD